MIHATMPTTQPTTTPKTLEEPSSLPVCAPLAPLATLDDMNSTVVDVETGSEVVDVTDMMLLS